MDRSWATMALDRRISDRTRLAFLPESGALGSNVGAFGPSIRRIRIEHLGEMSGGLSFLGKFDGIHEVATGVGTFKVETETDGCGSAPGPSAGGTFRRGLPASRGVACRFELRTGQ